VASVQKRLDHLSKISFGSGSAKLTSGDASIVKQIAGIMADNPDIHLRVEGDTDSAGPAAFNLAMSRRRAHAVAAELRKLGVAKDRLTVVGYGETRPKAPNDTAAHRAANRRVELKATTRRD
jgi:OOP family OmpA-OmpF porin